MQNAELIIIIVRDITDLYAKARQTQQNIKNQALLYPLDKECAKAHCVPFIFICTRKWHAKMARLKDSLTMKRKEKAL